MIISCAAIPLLTPRCTDGGVPVTLGKGAGSSPPAQRWQRGGGFHSARQAGWHHCLARVLGLSGRSLESHQGCHLATGFLPLAAPPRASGQEERRACSGHRGLPHPAQAFPPRLPSQRPKGRACVPLSAGVTLLGRIPGDSPATAGSGTRGWTRQKQLCEAPSFRLRKSHHSCGLGGGRCACGGQLCPAPQPRHTSPVAVLVAQLPSLLAAERSTCLLRILCFTVLQVPTFIFLPVGLICSEIT